MFSPYNFNHLSTQNKEVRDSNLASIRKVLNQLTAATDAELSNPNIHSPAFSSEYAAYLAKALLRLERVLFLGAANADPHVPDFWVELMLKSDFTDQVALWIEPDRVTIRLPYLPHRYRGNQDTINQMLAARIHLCPKFPHWKFWHADFIHVYPTQFSGVPKDVDNYSYKRTIDVLAFAMHTADDAAHFDMAISTVFNDDYESGVYIEITPLHPDQRKLPPEIAKFSSKEQ